MNQTFTNILLCVLIAVVLVATAMVQQALKQQNDRLAALDESIANQQMRPAFPARPDAAASTPSQPPIDDNDTGGNGADRGEEQTGPEAGADADADASRPAGVNGGQGATAPPDIDSTQSTDAPADDEVEAQRDGATDEPASSEETDEESDRQRAAVEAAWKEHASMVTEVIRALLAGRYEAVRDRLTADLRGQMTVDMMDSVMTPIHERHGGFKEVLDYDRPDRYVPAGVHAFRVEVATERDQPLTFSITIDPGGRIAGLMIK